MDKNYEGKGIMARSLSLVTDVCFNETELVKFFLRIDPENISSRRVAEKAGFLVEGIIRKDFKTGDGTLKDLVYYGLLQP